MSSATGVVAGGVVAGGAVGGNNQASGGSQSPNACDGSMTMTLLQFAINPSKVYLNSTSNSVQQLALLEKIFTQCMYSNAISHARESVPDNKGGHA